MVSDSDLADTLDQLRMIALIEAATGLLVANEGGHGDVLRRLTGHDVSINAVHLGRKLVKGTYHFPWRETIESRRPYTGIAAVMEPWAGVVALAAGDAMKRSTISGTPLSEFARHVRNAVAHDWHFDIRRMPGPAEFDGLVIEKTMDGKPLMDYLAVGDLFAMIDAVIAALRSAP
ncbi:hypothetical protein PFZ55_39850 [Streptomyces sp. MS2A]|nr:hypothetical protein [Streptomyces sp. MS2A]